MEKLTASLSQYDGKTVAQLHEIEQRFDSDANYSKSLINEFDNSNQLISDSATWLFKSHAETNSISPNVTLAFARASVLTTSWAAQLHVCQTVRLLTFSPKDADTLAQWVQPLLNHKKPFLRAWSLDALCALAKIETSLTPLASSTLENARTDKAASVRARARNLNR